MYQENLTYTPVSHTSEKIRYHQIRRAEQEDNQEELERLLSLPIERAEMEALTRRELHTILQIAATNGHVEMIKRIIELMPDLAERDVMIRTFNDRLAQLAAMNNQLDVLKYLLELSSNSTKDVINNIVRRPFRDFSIKIIEYLLTIASPDQALEIAKKNITPELALQAIERRALHTVWYSLDCPVSEHIVKEIKLGTENKGSTLIYFSFLLATERLTEQLKLEPMDQKIITDLHSINIPSIIKYNQSQSLLMLDMMLVPITRVYRICKYSNQFSLLKLPIELRHKILWGTISDDITDLIPEIDYCLAMFISVSSFYSSLKDGEVALDPKLGDSISKYNIAYTLSFLYTFEKHISNSLKKPSLDQY